jgi:hypothetical protein
LKSGYLSTIYNEHMFKIDIEGIMPGIAVFMKNDPKKVAGQAAPDNGGHGR